MGKALTAAAILVAAFWAFGGMAGGLLAWALAVPIGVIVGLFALAAGWFNKR